MTIQLIAQGIIEVKIYSAIRLIYQDVNDTIISNTWYKVENTVEDGITNILDGIQTNLKIDIKKYEINT